jgi:hypothetical protein
MYKEFKLFNKCLMITKYKYCSFRSIGITITKYSKCNIEVEIELWWFYIDIILEDIE